VTQEYYGDENKEMQHKKIPGIHQHQKVPLRCFVLHERRSKINILFIKQKRKKDIKFKLRLFYGENHSRASFRQNH
jgi:hypothetical protein